MPMTLSLFFILSRPKKCYKKKERQNKRHSVFKDRKDFKGENVLYVGLNLVASFVFNNKNM